MLIYRDNIVLLFAIFFCLYTFAASVTFVANAQETKRGAALFPPAAMEKPESLSPDNIETDDASADPLESGDTDKGPSATIQDVVQFVSVSGRALDANDKGRPNVAITLYEADGTPHEATSDRSGNFRFEKVADGQRISLSAQDEPDKELDVELRIAGETRVFWRTPDPNPKTKNGE
jgi:hypothetical protein